MYLFHFYVCFVTIILQYVYKMLQVIFTLYKLLFSFINVYTYLHKSLSLIEL